MYYGLLCIKAKDKAYILHTSDSLILPILNYYIEKNDKQHLPEAYYYAGRVYRDLGDAPQALEYFQKAMEASKGSSNNQLTSRINSQIGTLFLYQGIYDEALKVFKQAYFYNTLANDSIGIVLTLRDIADTFDCLQKTDSAFYYNNQAQKYAQKLNNIKLKNVIYSQTASFYKELKNYDSAKQIIQPCLNDTYFPSRSSIYSIAAELYQKTGNLDSAYYYYKKIQDCGTIYALQAAYLGLAEINLIKKDPQNALKNLTLYIQYTDSILKLTNTESIRKMHSLYNYQFKEKENNLLKSRNERQMLWFTSIGAAFFLISVCFGLYWEHSKRKQIQMQLQLNKLDTLRKEQYLQSIQAVENNKKKINELKEKLQGLKEKNGLQAQLLQAQKEQIEKANILIGARQEKRKIEETRFHKSDIYSFFQNTTNEGETKVSPEHWITLQKEIDSIYNNFTYRLLDLHDFSNFELQVCLLLKAKFPITRVAFLTNHSKSAIVSVRKRMYSKVFQKSGTPDDWDNFITSF